MAYQTGSANTDEALYKPMAQSYYDNIAKGGTVNSDVLSGSQSLVNLPTKTPQTYPTITPPVTPDADPLKNMLEQYIGAGEAPDPNALEKKYSQDYASSGIDNIQNTVNAGNNAVTQEQANLSAINAQIQGIVDESTKAQLQLEKGGGFGGGGTSSYLSSEANKIAKEAAIRSLPLQSLALASQARIQALQGNLQAQNTLLTQAKERVDKLFSIQVQDLENQTNYNKELGSKIWSYMDSSEKKQWETKQKQEDRDFQLKRDELARQHDVSMAQLEASLKPVVTSGTGGVDANGNPIVNPAQLGVINDINTIIDDPALTSTFGWGNILKRNVPGSAEYNLKQLTSNLTDKLALAARGQLKGQGTVSDFEGKMLKNAQTALKFNMDPAQAMQQLLNVRGAIATSSGLTATVEVKDLATGESQIMTANQAGIQQAIKDGLLVTYK
jgi:hypothetical protein